MGLAGLALLAVAALPAPAGNFLDFDGANDRVMVPYDPSFPTDVFTAAAWVRTAPPQGRSAIIARGEDDDSYNLVWQLYVVPDGTMKVMLEDAGETNHCYPSTCMGQPQPGCTSGDLSIADSTWHHVAATRDASGELVIYIDGNEQVTCQSTGLPSPNNAQFLTIGCTHGTIGIPQGPEPPIWFFPGEIDEPAMWNVALTEAEIAEVYLGGVDPGDTGLVGYWNFEEGAGQVVSDLSPAGNHGFLGENASADSADPQWAAHVGPGAVPDGGAVLGLPLRLGKNAIIPTDLNLSWGAGCGETTNDYSVHEGSLGSFYSHTAHTCATSGAIAVTLTPGAGETYYLVVPLNDDAEGSYGTGLGGAGRPRSTAACRPFAVADACR